MTAGITVLDQVIGLKRDSSAVDELLAALSPLPMQGSVYVGYPLLALPWQSHLDVFVACAEHGVLALDLWRGAAHASEAVVVDRHATIGQALVGVLGRSRQLLMQGRLSIGVRIVTVDPDLRPGTADLPSRAPEAPPGGGSDAESSAADPPLAHARFRPRFSARPLSPTTPPPATGSHLDVVRTGRSELGSQASSTRRSTRVIGLSDVPAYLAQGTRIDRNTLRRVHAAVQRLGNARPAPAVQTLGELAGPRAAVLAEIDREIVSLDKWQTRAALEIPTGPQRIRGLAGSGKTVILAHKAAILHASEPRARIALTFHVRTLQDTFRELVTRFFREQQSVDAPPRDPDWSRLQILPAWGGKQPGVYALVADHLGVARLALSDARARHGKARAFYGACQDVLSAMGRTEPAPLFDVVLIDEAQDLPRTFFEMVYRVTAPPKRVVWAYDELQNLTADELRPPAVLFGTDAAGRPRVPELPREEGVADPDVILPVCYRNTRWALTVAHALGLGVYRVPPPGAAGRGLVQFYADPELWDDIGYVVADGRLEPGFPVTLARDPQRSPAYFERLVTPADAVECRGFPDLDSEAEWVAEQIERNLSEDGLVARQILIVSADPYFRIEKALPFVRALHRRNIESHEARGDAVHGPAGSVPIAVVNRAKGNEAPMVYVVQSEHAAGARDAHDVLKRRNAMFTAITRSRAWVRITGSGDDMAVIEREVAAVIGNGYRLRLTVPTAVELQRMARRLRRDQMRRRRAQRRDRT